MYDHLEARDYVQNGTMPVLRRAQLQAVLDDLDQRVKHPDACVKHPGFYQRLKAMNDSNGNSRRLYVFYNWFGGMEAVHKEYYNRPAKCDGRTELPSVEIGLGEYHSWISHAKEAGIWQLD